MSSPGDNRDAGFCSGEDEDLDVDHVDTDADNSPTDVSEDSVDVKVRPIAGINKRKHSPGSRRTDDRAKKPCTQEPKSLSPFRPWSIESPKTNVVQVPCGYVPQKCRPSEQDEPLSLVVKTVPKREDRIYKPKYAGKLGAFRNSSPEPIVPKLELDGSPRPPEAVRKSEAVFSSPLSRPPISSDVRSFIVNQSQQRIVPKVESLPCDVRSLRPPGVVLKTESVPFSDVRNLSLNQFPGIVPKAESVRSHGRDLSPNQGPPKLRIKMEKREEELMVPESHPAFRGLPVKKEPGVDSRYELSHELEARQLELRHLDPRQLELLRQESRQLELRQQESGQLDSRQLELRHLDPRQLELLRQESRQLELRQQDHRQSEFLRQDSEQESRQSELRQPMPSTSGQKPKKTCKSSQAQQRNYKNMTRERRMEANARERTRVHTISAAFETLRHSVPAYSHNQKLSKLSVLRIACSYIMTLSRLAGLDYSADQSEPTISSCVDNVSKTIQMEGKLRKKKDEH